MKELFALISRALFWSRGGKALLIMSEIMFMPPHRMYVKVDFARAGEWQSLAKSDETLEEKGLVEGVRLCACSSEDDNPESFFSSAPSVGDVDMVLESDDSDDETSPYARMSAASKSPSLYSLYDTRSSSHHPSGASVTNGTALWSI